MKVPFLDLHAAYEELRPELDAAALRVLNSGWYILGEEVSAFEREYAEFCEAAECVGVGNGLDALQLALRAVGVGAGDEVIVPSHTYIAPWLAVSLVGAKPVPVEPKVDTYNLDPAATRAKVKAVDADAILAVHLYGLPAAMDALSEIAAEENVALIEDAAQAHGARYAGEPVGTFGDAAAFSFYPTKNMTTGEGGMVLTDHEAVADQAASFINHGRTGDDSYAHTRVGHNFRLTSLAAAIGRVQLDRLPEWVARRRENARRLTDGLAAVDGIETPHEPANRTHAYHQYTIRTPERDRLREQLTDRGVDTGVYYPTAIHQLAAYEGFDVSAPAAEAAAEEVVSLPVHPTLSDADLDRIVEATRRAVTHLRA